MAKIGELRLSTDSGIQPVPIYEVGDAEAFVYEYLRINTPNGVGFIPVADQSKAAFPYAPIEVDDEQTLALHDDVRIRPHANDSYEDNDILEYTHTGKGSKSEWKTNTNHAQQGSYSLYSTSTSFGDAITRYDQKTEAGHHYRFYTYIPSDQPDYASPRQAQPVWRFGVQDGNNYYRAVIDYIGVTDKRTHRIRKVKDGTLTKEEEYNHGQKIRDRWVRGDIKWYEDGKIEFTWNNKTASITDDEYKLGGWGWETENDGNWYGDNVHRVQRL